MEKRSQDATSDVDATKCAGLKSEWEKHMESFNEKAYQKVEVLLLYWDKISPSYLDTAEEVTAKAREFVL